MARYKLNHSKSGKTKKSTSSNASVRRANQRVRDAESAGFRTTSKFTESVRSGRTARPASGSTDLSDGTVRSTARGIQGGQDTLTSDSLKRAGQIRLPTRTEGKNLSGLTDGINTSLAGATGGTYDPAKGFVPPTSTESTPTTGADQFNAYLSANASAYADKTSGESLVRDMQDELRPKENLVNSLQNQITTITNTRDADQLGLEGQGRGIKESIIGGQQARIGREAAIQALPIQSQLAAAQGDLDSARSYLGQLYTAKAQDAQNEYNYRTALNSSIYNFLDSQEKARLAVNEKQLDREYSQQTANTAYQHQLGLTAIEYGQGSLITGISAIDPSSPTFEEDIALITSQLRKPVTGGKATSEWELKDVDGTSMWVNKFTQEVKAAGDTSLSGVDGAGGELDKIDLLKDTLARIMGRDADAEAGEEAYKPLWKAASQTPFTEFFGRTFTGSSDLDNLQVYAKTLSSNMLTLATDPAIKSFYGPQMSEADVRGMEATATRLQAENMTPTQFLSEAKRLQQFVGKYEASVRAKQEQRAPASDVVYSIVSPNGIEIDIIPE